MVRTPAALIALPAALVLAPALAAQLRIYTAQAGGVEQLIAGAYDFGEAPAGDTLEVRFRLRNTGSSNISLTRLSMAERESAFVIAGDPTLPFLMTPGVNVDFRVRFRSDLPGTFNGSVRFNDQFLLVAAKANATFTVAESRDGTLVVRVAGDTIDLGRAERGSTSLVTLVLANLSATPVTIGEMLTSEPFRLSGVETPLHLESGDTAGLQVIFAPTRAGVSRGTLTIGGRSFTLTGLAQDPPFPEPLILFSTENVASAQQVKVSVRLAAASKLSGTGRMSMELVPISEGLNTDPAIQFLASGAREIALSVAEGAQSATVDGSAETTFQTGTTAGTLVFTVRLGDRTAQALLRVAPAAAAIDAKRAARASNALDVQIAGFDNTRTVSKLRFRFFRANGSAVNPEPIDAEVGPEFRRFFESSVAGGLFALRAVFPVAGSAAEVTGVEVEIVSGAGVAQTGRIGF